MKPLLRWFVDRPLIVNLIMILTILLGWYSLETGAIKGPPDMTNAYFSITTVRAGASAEKMELSVTVPLEDELHSVSGVKEIRSNSLEGLSLIQVNGDAGADEEELADLAKELQRAIDRAASRLPQDLLRKPLLVQAKSEDFPVAVLMLHGTAPMETMRRLARRLQDQVRELPGIRGADRLGYPDREVLISLDPLRLNQLGVSIGEIESAIKSRNVTETGGSLASFVGEQDVVAVGEFAHPKDVADVVIRSDGPGNYLRVGDIATVTDAFSEPTRVYLKDGHPGIMVTVRADGDTNDLRTVRALRGMIDEFRTTLPPTVKLDIVDDNSRITKVMIATLVDNAMLGMILITLVLAFFFPWRAMVWVLAGIPIAMLLGMALMPYFGVSYNNVAWVALVLILGLVVDDAIVTSESIYRHFEEGMAPRDAATQGVAVIASPVITGALTTVLAMAPLILMGGEDAKFMWVIPATVILVIVASLFECMFLLPSHIAESLHRAGPGREKADWFRHVERFYVRGLRPLLERPGRSLFVGLMAAAVGGVLIANFLRMETYPVTDANDILLGIELQPGAPLEETQETLLQIEKRVREVIPPAILKDVFSVAGENASARFDDMIPVRKANLGKLELNIVDSTERDLHAIEVADIVMELRSEFPRIRQFNAEVDNEQPPAGIPVEVWVITQDDAVRGQVSDAIKGWLEQHPYTTTVATSYAPGKSVIRLDLDYQRMAHMDLAVADVTRALRIAYDGLLVEELQTVEERIRYRLRLKDEYRNDVNALRSLVVLNRRGEQVPLRNIANFRVEQGPSVITHRDGRRTETVTAEIDRGQITTADINQQLRDWVSGQDFEKQYPGLRLVYQGELVKQAETAETMGMGMLLVLASIFFLMVLLFNSLAQPLVVMAVIPLAFIAVLLALMIHGIVLSMSAMVGFLGLAGVLVNSSLVLVDYVNRLHRERYPDESEAKLHWPCLDDILAAAKTRLRPILITGMTTGAGLGPAAYGVAGSHPTQTPMIMVMFWGGIVGAVVTLFTVPLLLAAFSKLSDKEVRGQVLADDDQAAGESAGA